MRYFPGIHVGRVWAAYYLFSIPIQWQCGQTLKVPFVGCIRWVHTLQLLLFWYVGLTGFSNFQRRVKTKTKQLVYGIFALGWNGSVGIG